jgi:hypothetical protein
MAACVRSAWLDLYGDGTITMPLESVAGGWFCTSLDLGYPQPREVVSDRPDQDGVDDRTRFMGSRVVTADISALTGAGARIDAVASQFAPYMTPAARPILHYVLDRPGAAERVLTLRASGYAWPVAGPTQRDIQLSWVAADPIVRDPVVKSATSWAGVTGSGRTYPLTFNRIYPVGGASQTTAIISSPGDIGPRPVLRIYGPISGPRVLLGLVPTGAGPFNIVFLSTYVIDAGHFVDVDMARKTAYRDADRSQSVLGSLDWVNTKWGVLPAAPGYTQMTLSGSGTTAVSQVQATWQDGYLS